jgi:hypothetical protein
VHALLCLAEQEHSAPAQPGSRVARPLAAHRRFLDLTASLLLDLSASSAEPGGRAAGARAARLALLMESVAQLADLRNAASLLQEFLPPGLMELLTGRTAVLGSRPKLDV